MQIFVRTFTGQHITLQVESSNTIENVRSKIQARTHSRTRLRHAVQGLRSADEHGYAVKSVPRCSVCAWWLARAELLLRGARRAAAPARQPGAGGHPTHCSTPASLARVAAGQRGRSAGPAAPHFRRQAAVRWPHAGRLQHPGVEHAGPGGAAEVRSARGPRRGCALDVPHASAWQARVRGRRGGMMIKVKTLTGKEIEIDIEPTDTIERIKERVEEKEGIPPVQQRCGLLAGRRSTLDIIQAADSQSLSTARAGSSLRGSR